MGSNNETLIPFLSREISVKARGKLEVTRSHHPISGVSGAEWEA